MPILTIVTVVKDDQVGLDSTLASIARQESVDSADVEVVVVDGSSSPLQIEDRAFPSTSVHHEPPRGIYAAMNVGLSLARGSFIYFLNAGDTLIDSTVLERLISELESSPSSWTYGSVEFRDRQGHVMHEPPWSYAEERRRLFARGVFPAHQGTVVRTELLRDLGGFDEKYLVAADYKMMLTLSNAGAPKILPWPIASFTQGGTSTAEWKVALREFHRARKEIYQPQGRTRVIEWIDTAVHSARTTAHRAIGSIRG